MADISNNRSFQENFYYYQRNMRDYSDTVHEYNRNMTNYLSIMNYLFVADTPGQAQAQTHVRERPPTRPAIYTPSITSIASSIRDLIQRRDEGDIFTRAFEDVTVRPTRTQIAQAIEVVLYDNTAQHSSCSITLEQFQQGEEVCRIIGCGHMFKPAAIYQWFQRNVRCPVCRYDIRDYVQETNDDTEFDDVIEELNREQTASQTASQRVSQRASQTPSQRTTEPLSQRENSSSNRNIFSMAIQNFITSELRRLPASSPFSELIYTFDIPLDISGGEL